jgi:hypothetical protein
MDLHVVNTILGASDARQGNMPVQAPSYTSRAHPVVQHLEPLAAEEGRLWDVHAKYYECGVVSLEWESPFELTWSRLTTSSPSWISPVNGPLCRIVLNVESAFPYVHAYSTLVPSFGILLPSFSRPHGRSQLARVQRWVTA